MRHLVTFFVASVALCGQARPPATLLSAQKELALGRQVAAQIRARTTALPLPTIENYLSDLCRELEKQIPNGPAAWELRVVREDSGSTHEPLALPGGNIFVPAALVRSAQSEPELAGMMAHAVIHVTAQTSLVQLDGVATIPLFFVGVNFGLDGKSEPILPLKVASLQQGRELEADATAARVMAAAGFDPSGLLRYVERTQRDAESRSSKYEALPPRAVRLAALSKTLEGLKTSEARPPSPAFVAAQNSLRLAQTETAAIRKPSSLAHPNGKN